MSVSRPEAAATRPAPRVVYLGERARFHGGGEMSLVELARGMASSGFEPLVLLPDAGPIASQCGAAGIAWERFPLPRFRRPIAVLAAALRLARLLRRTGAVIVHTGGPRAAVIAGLAGRWSGTPHIFHVRAARAERWPGDPLIHALADRVIAVSRAAAHRSRTLAASARVRIVPTGIPPIAFLERNAARVVLGIPPQALVFGVVGRVEADKGADTVLAAWPSVRAACPGSCLVFLGAIDPAFAAPAARPDAGDLLFLGEHPGAARYLPAFDGLVHAARHEALPRTLIEAAFASVPVLATRVGGSEEILPDGDCAVLVEPDDPGALAAAWVEFARDPVRRRRLADNARGRAAGRFDLGTMIRLVQATYDEVRRMRAAPGHPVEASPR